MVNNDPNKIIMSIIIISQMAIGIQLPLADMAIITIYE